MRFDDMLIRLGAVAVVATAMVGCASLPDPIAMVKQAVTPSSDEAKPAEATPDASTPCRISANADVFDCAWATCFGSAASKSRSRCPGARVSSSS